MSQLNVDTIKKADGTGNLSVPANTGTLVDTSGATFTGAIAMGANNISFSNGNGIDFSASEGSGATSSILVDYEEGTWTPTYNASGASPTVTYSIRVGRYVKIGTTVTVWWQLRASAYTAGSGSLQVTGLPFPASSASDINNIGSVNFEQFNFSSGRTMAVAFIANSADVVTFQEMGDSIDVRQLQSNELIGSLRMTRGTITYLTDS